mmetsp:Transcript_22801/g.52481  ORF Transcript_22801/g.52481 Transcript_22801/m.52481 type:complete len:421 (+) Transcript_22801:94-1356(+)
MKAIKSEFKRPSRRVRATKSFLERYTNMTPQRLVVASIATLALGSLVFLQSVLTNHANYSASSSGSFLRNLASKLYSEYKVTELEQDPGLYQPAPVEQYVYDHRVELGYEPKDETSASEGCKIWNDPQESTIYDELHQYRQEIPHYWEALHEYNWIEQNNITDIRKHLFGSDSHHPDFCKNLELDPAGRDLKTAYFNTSQQLSKMQSTGFLEPLLTPMRHPNFCIRKQGNILNIEYLVHDFAHMCRQLKPTSRIVLLDMGASPRFAGASNPMWKILNLFQTKFGFKFDHIYSFEIKHFEPTEVYKLVPRHLHPAYHWINAGVSIEEGHALNPWTLLDEFNEDDLVIVKLDIDTPQLEVPLAHQLLNNPSLWNKVDHFYFEHHVRQEENNFWKRAWDGSIKDTLELFHGLRKRGVSSHFWV